jgi:hypothetical protein
MELDQLEIELLERKVALAKRQATPLPVGAIPKSVFGCNVRVPGGVSSMAPKAESASGSTVTTSQSITPQHRATSIIEPVVSSTEMFNFHQIINQITTYYANHNKENTFDDIKLELPRQITEMSEVLFCDSNDVLIASARVKLHNFINLDKTTGNLSIPLSFTDLSIGVRQISVNSLLTNDKLDKSLVNNDKSSDI